MQFQTVQAVILLVIAVGSALFGVYAWVRTPQEQLDKRQAVDQKEVDGKANVLAYQVTADREATDRRFTDFGNRLEAATTLAQNHIHTVDTKVDALRIDFNTQMLSVTKELTRLATVIEERIPKKHG